MNKKQLEELKKNLETSKKGLEKELTKIATKEDKPEGDWDTRFPQWNGDSGSSALERAADQVEEYSKLISLEHTLETRLKDIDSALEKMKKGKYGICEKCGKKISEEKLKILPAARTCKKCQ